VSSSYNRKDHLYHKAKEEGYRSRAAYKLAELQAKHKLFKPSSKVLDLGAWPGGWLQVVAQNLNEKGLAVGIDLVQIEDLHHPRIKLLQGDVQDPESINKACELAGGKFDLVLSDMSPKLTGIREADNQGALACAEAAINAAKLALNSGGNFVCKVFKSNEAEMFVKSLKPLFNKVERRELDTTRNTSNEFYAVALGFKDQNPSGNTTR
jgi:23S rRNA (uridine2552-2'-O)-methyltransferase